MNVVMVMHTQKCVKCTAQIKTCWPSGYVCFCKHTSQVASSNPYSYILNF